MTVIAGAKREAIHLSATASVALDCFASLAMTGFACALSSKSKKHLKAHDIVPQTHQKQQQVGQRQAGDARPVAGVRHQKSVRQSRLDGIAVPERLARRYRLRAGPAGSVRGRHGRRLRPGHPQRRLRQSSFRRRRRQRARQHLHRAPQPDPAGDHRGPAGAQHFAAAGVSLCRARLGISAALCQVFGRARACRRRAGGDRARLLRGDAAALRTDLCLGADRRLDPSDASRRSPPRQPRARS